MADVDTHKEQSIDRQAAIRSLREMLEQAQDPGIRESLLKTLAELEDAGTRGQVGGDSGSGVRTWEPGAGKIKQRIVAALAAAGLTASPPDSAEGRITENARVVLEHRYLLKDDSWKVIETVEGLFRRVAKAIAEPDGDFGATPEQVAETEEAFYQAMVGLEFLPNSPTLMNAGTDAGTLSACFVLPLGDSMDAIMQTASDIAMVQKFGGGTGVPLSNLRAKGAHISTTHGRACGPIAVLRHLSSVSTMITQGGKRDGANMAVMDVHHPDVEEFITCKTEEGLIHNYNISVGVTDDFMEAVRDDGTVEVREPQTGVVMERRGARELFQKIVEGAWLNGEPGMIFLDEVNRNHPTPNLGRMEATNPCGEQPLLPYESCNLGSINMANMLSYASGSGQAEETAEIDWEKLREIVHLATRFLDNTIEANHYSVPEIERVNKLTRKIGLGVMGFADMLVRMGIPYDSEEGVETGRQVMRFIAQESRAQSERLAEQRGPFDAWQGSRPQERGEKAFRNACQLTVAPTGTISMIAGCSSGVEPLFALAYRKHNILEGQTLYYVDQAFEAVARHEGLYSDDLAESLSQGNALKQALSESEGSSQDVPEWVKQVFVTAPDISPDWHVRMQAAFQESTDAAISKTINFPNQATVEDVREAYLLAWQLQCKGITVYRAGSREKEVLTAGTVEQGAGSTEQGTGAAGQGLLTPETQPLKTPGGLVPRRRPTRVQGVTERIRTGHGNIYITINFDDTGRPFEVFTALGKAGGSDSAQLEAVARLVSMSLRARVDPEEIVAQLRGITDEPVWDNGVLVRSAPDAIAHALARAIGLEKGGDMESQLALFQKEQMKGAAAGLLPGAAEDRAVIKANGRGNGNGRSGWGSCPECSGPLVYQEGCLTCRECGYNRCG